MLNTVRQVKERQIKEANEGLEGLRKSRELADIRKTYYETREFMNAEEVYQQSRMEGSVGPRRDAMIAHLVAKYFYLTPDFKVGSPTTWGFTIGGSFFGQASVGYAEYRTHAAAMLEHEASMEATMGGYARRQDDWILQKDLAVKEIEQADKQITAAEIRLAIAERDLKNHDQQTENAKQVDAFMRDKFTSRELYDWMAGQISGVYFQSYQLAYDIAKRAERAYRHELGLRESSFIQFGYWDSMKKGLMAGELLHHDLKRMEVAYLDENKREYEITKHLSLAMLDPVALVQLKQTGTCFVSLPEAVFDLDYPGHYLRRLKSVSVTIPCVTGPYTSVNCTLTLIRSSVRLANTLLGGKYLRQDNDARFVDSIGAVQSIVTSSAQNDSGLFDPNLRDERYLPFEGGASSVNGGLSCRRPCRSSTTTRSRMS